MFGEISYWGAVSAGLVASFTPCILPMVPFYLSYMAGISMTELRGDDEIAPGAQRRLVVSALFFALGVTTIFGLLGLGATAAGQAFAQWKQELSYIAAAVIFIFGLHFLHVIRIPFLDQEARIDAGQQGGGALGAYQAGAYAALHEAGYRPEWIAGISIGAINAAIVAGNPPERRVERLEAFWNRVTSGLPSFPIFPQDQVRELCHQRRIERVVVVDEDAASLLSMKEYAQWAEQRHVELESA